MERIKQICRNCTRNVPSQASPSEFLSITPSTSFKMILALFLIALDSNHLISQVATDSLAHNAQPVIPIVSQSTLKDVAHLPDGDKSLNTSTPTTDLEQSSDSSCGTSATIETVMIIQALMKDRKRHLVVALGLANLHAFQLDMKTKQNIEHDLGNSGEEREGDVEQYTVILISKNLTTFYFYSATNSTTSFTNQQLFLLYIKNGYQHNILFVFHYNNILPIFIKASYPPLSLKSRECVLSG